MHRKLLITVATTLSIAALFVLVVGLPIGHGQAAPAGLEKVPQSLEEILAGALDSNPDILVAAAKVRAAQAELNQVRLQVTQEVVGLFHSRAELRKTREFRVRSLKSLETRVQAGVVSHADLDVAMISLAESEAKLAAVEAKIRYTIGAGGLSPNALDGGQPSTDKKAASAPIPEKYAEKLDSLRISVQFDEKSLDEAINALVEITGMNFLIDPDIDAKEVQVGLAFSQDVSLRQLLTALSDTQPFYFVFRDYGILVTVRENVPDGAPTIPQPR